MASDFGHLYHHRPCPHLSNRVCGREKTIGRAQEPCSYSSPPSRDGGLHHRLPRRPPRPRIRDRGRHKGTTGRCPLRTDFGAGSATGRRKPPPPPPHPPARGGVFPFFFAPDETPPPKNPLLKKKKAPPPLEGGVLGVVGV